MQSFSAGVASVIYETGDVISLVTTAASGNALNNGTINVISAAGFSTAKNDKGSLSVFIDGTHSYFAFGTAATVVLPSARKALVTTMLRQVSICSTSWCLFTQWLLLPV